MSNDLSPIVLFVYNRLSHTRKTIEALKKNELAQESELFIYSDAAKNKIAESNVNEVREYIKAIDGFEKVTIIERDKNWGLANSIIDGVTKIVNEYGKIIVLEDDLLTSPYFLRFMNEALDVYEGEKKVWEIGGYVYPVEFESNEESYMLPITTSWGWATWKNRWENFERNPQKLISNFSKQDIKQFNCDGTTDIWSQVISNSNGDLYTWAVFWYANVFQNKGLVLYPYKSIVTNIGHDGSGENCGSSNKFQNELLNKRITINEIKDIKVNIENYKKVKEFFIRNEDALFIKILKNIYRKIFK
jgi:GT2 family glycosyltransferase